MSEKDAATVLEEAADLLLIHGRARGTGRNGNGELCVLGAIAEAVAPGWNGDEYWQAVTDYCGGQGYPAVHALAARLPDQDAREHWTVYEWNDDPAVTDDDVRDTLLTVAKDIRNEARS